MKLNLKQDFRSVIGFTLLSIRVTFKWPPDGHGTLAVPLIASHLLFLKKMAVEKQSVPSSSANLPTNTATNGTTTDSKDGTKGILKASEGKENELVANVDIGDHFLVQRADNTWREYLLPLPFSLVIPACLDIFRIGLVDSLLGDGLD